MTSPRPPRILLRRHAETIIPRTLRGFTGDFLALEASSGLLLLAAAVIALAWINSPWGGSYEDLWTTPISADLGIVSISQDLRYVVNDGLMTLFFFVVGLEIKRELRHGELSQTRNAVLPIVAALGGMALPALFYAAVNQGGEGGSGWGIPMATDIAFAVGVLSLVGARVPLACKVFLLGLAVVDDLGAIVVIAIFYSGGIDFAYLAAAVALVLLVAAMNLRGVRSVAWYTLAGICGWVALEQSGVQPAVLGAILGLLTPAQPFYEPESVPDTVGEMAAELTPSEVDHVGRESLLSQLEDVASGAQSPLDRLERAVHPWANYLVLPIFGLANAGVDLSPDVLRDAAGSAVSQGIVLGLIAGKALGIFGASYIACRLRICDLPAGLGWRHIAGVSLLGGIGFTVSLFIAGQAFDTAGLLSEAKVGILAGSILAGALGFAFLSFVSDRGGSSAAQ